MKKIFNPKGFTLIEVMIVIVIILIIGSTTIPNLIALNKYDPENDAISLIYNSYPGYQIVSQLHCEAEIDDGDYECTIMLISPEGKDIEVEIDCKPGRGCRIDNKRWL